MKTYRVTVYTTIRSANFITIEADSEEAAEIAARDIFFEDDRAFSTKLLDESVEDISTKLEA